MILKYKNKLIYIYIIIFKLIYLINYKLIIKIKKMEQKNEIDIYKINTPIDVIKQSIGKEVYIKCKFNRELKGKLHVIYILYFMF